MKEIKELVSGAKKGSQKAFNKLYDLTKNDIWLTCISLLKNEENAKDVMQETYITAFLKLETLENEDKFCPWLRMTAVNKSKDFLKGKVEYQIEDEVLTNEVETNEVMLPEEYITNNSKREIILQLMSDTLTHSQYVTVFLFYFDELSISEISEVLEVSEGTVKSRLNSSRKKMKTAIEKYEEENNDRLHGVVFVPLFGSIFKEQCKYITVPKIDLVLPKQGSDSIASFGAENAVKTASKGLVSSVAKTRVIAMLLGMTVICGTSISTGVLAGCGREDLPIATTASTAEVTTEPTEETKPTVSEEVKEAVKDNGLKVNDKGEVVDAKGNKVEVKDGKVEVTTDDGKKVTIKVDEVKEVTQPTKGSSSEPKETQKATQPTKKPAQPAIQATKKPATSNTKPATSNTKPATPKPTPKPTEATKATEAIWHDPVYKTVHHDAVTKEVPVYETQRHYFCNTCGADLTELYGAGNNDARSAHAKQHALNGENNSQAKKSVQVQVGTEIVVVKEAWTEQVLVKEGYWEYK